MRIFIGKDEPALGFCHGDQIHTKNLKAHVSRDYHRDLPHHLYHVSKLIHTSHPNKLRSCWALQVEDLGQTPLFAGSSHCIKNGEQHGGSQEHCSLTQPLRGR